jgi:hypothetical protein
MGICENGDEDKYSPTAEIENGDAEYCGGQGAGKLPPLIPRLVDIPNFIFFI